MAGNAEFRPATLARRVLHGGMLYTVEIEKSTGKVLTQEFNSVLRAREYVKRYVGCKWAIFESTDHTALRMLVARSRVNPW